MQSEVTDSILNLNPLYTNCYNQIDAKTVAKTVCIFLGPRP